MIKSSVHVAGERLLLTPIEKIKGAAASVIKPLKRLGIHTVYDLLFHVPFRYEDFSRKMPIAEVRPDETVTVSGLIEHIRAARTWKRRMHLTEATVSDATGSIRAVWYNQPFLLRTLSEGKAVYLSGKAVHDGKSLVLQNPAYELAGKEKTPIHTGRLVPVYRETSGITSRWLRYLVKNALAAAEQVKDPLPEEMKERRQLVPLSSAIASIHFPKTQKEAARARYRLAFEELLFLQLMTLQERAALKKESAPPIPFQLEATKRFVASLPFQLTNAQRKAAWEILQDMEKKEPMNRLLEGDVGSGKTVVAAIAALNAAQNGWQTAVMAPTEVLALQHFHGFTKLFSLAGHDVGMLTGSSALLYDAELQVERKLAKRDLITLTAAGKVPVVVGTHALFSEAVRFQRLGLIVLDEQHRFGVDQRAALSRAHERVAVPHLLSMTATPIPRTLALTVFGDLDISLLNEMPKNRKKIETRVVAPRERAAAYAFLRKEMKSGRQVFVICPRIEVPLNAADTRQYWTKVKQAEVKAVKQEYEKLSQEVFPDLRIGMLHGKMRPKEKEGVMRAFRDGLLDMLVSTSVIEVGVDVPNATVMMIEGAERFGLAQLHQFRGRVGRGEHQSYCLLFSEAETAETNRRLKALVEYDSGFALAEKDLEIRGPGDFFGTRQWGLPDLAMASLTDAELVKATREEAERMLLKDPYVIGHPELKKRLDEFHRRVHLE